MKIEIEIPKEFEEHFNQDKFKYSFDNFLKAYNSELLRVANQVDISYTYEDVCEWWLCDEEANVYDTSCRNPHILIEGTPQENNYEFCPYCGKKIRLVE